MTLVSCPPMSMTWRISGYHCRAPRAWQVISVSVLRRAVAPQPHAAAAVSCGDERGDASRRGGLGDRRLLPLGRLHGRRFGQRRPKRLLGRLAVIEAGGNDRVAEQPSAAIEHDAFRRRRSRVDSGKPERCVHRRPSSCSMNASMFVMLCAVEKNRTSLKSPSRTSTGRSSDSRSRSGMPNREFVLFGQVRAL